MSPNKEGKGVFGSSEKENPKEKTKRLVREADNLVLEIEEKLRKLPYTNVRTKKE